MRSTPWTSTFVRNYNVRVRTPWSGGPSDSDRAAAQRRCVLLFHMHLSSCSYDTSPRVRLESEDQSHVGFQHHPSLDTYTLTVAGPQRREQGAESSLQEEVTELRTLIGLHRHQKVS